MKIIVRNKGKKLNQQSLANQRYDKYVWVMTITVVIVMNNIIYNNNNKSQNNHSI